jgi:hypothetical protein
MLIDEILPVATHGHFPSPTLDSKNRVNWLAQLSKPFKLPSYIGYKWFCHLQINLNLVNTEPGYYNMKNIPEILKIMKNLRDGLGHKKYKKYLKLVKMSMFF